ncbi:hyaluronoglucosaminidase [Kribbella steppae]|uniref:Hyaluronoglucosaminidase n=1 Tax=Kribbella steppae TaxID=2512223 RepID=A0A4R2HG40_9ACTN|nr:beta-N-acetylglucosaminidase domain-containing protein [Kribbella steppae]TCO28171.1 hyaluronoglucosaminidase [Kribbella steppae]
MRRLALPLLLALVVQTLTVPAAVALAGTTKGAPPVTPEPQQTITRQDGFHLGRTVGLVHGPTTDPDAERVVRETLEQAGVRTVRDQPADVTIWLGGSEQALRQLNVEPAEGLAAEGYVLAIGGKNVVLDGVDTDGTYYAARTFAQVVQGNQVDGVEIRDWPTMRYRGSIEGFYGTPWSHADRLDHLDYLGAHRMNTYEYAPKDDPYHREQWRDPYPADKLAELGELIERAQRNKVDFTFALSPGLSICYTSDSDYQALIAKFESLYALGARAFNVPLDDIDYNTWHCPEDREKYGTGGGAAGQAQSELLNRIQREWVASKPDLAPLQMVPTEYYNVSETPYKKALREQLDAAVVVHWTGIGVVPRTITTAQAAQAKAVFGHDILIWDNYPVNDYAAGRILLADYSGREPGIAEHIAGVISNPMNQAAVSKLALYSFAELGWNPATYDEQASWHRAIAERAGGDRKTIAALEVFADLNTYDSTLHPESAPVLAARTAEFWKTWQAGGRDEAIAAIKPYFTAIENAPAQIRQGVKDPAFADEAKAWLDATVLWGQALDRSLRLLDEVAEGNGAAAWTSRQRIDALVTQAKAIRDTRLPHSNTYPRIGEGVADAFLTEAGRVHYQWMGIEPGRTASSSQGTYAENVPDRMIDGDESTYFWSNGAPVTGDEIRVDLGAPRAIGDIAVLMGKSGSPEDYIHSGALEYSVDGSSWTELTRATTAEVRFTADTTARYVRYRALADNPSFWLVVREFSVQVTDGSELVLTATGTPAPAEGSSLADAVDGDVRTAYVAATTPTTDDALTVALSSATAVDRITVLQSGDATAVGRLEVRTSAGWQEAGRVGAAYSAVTLPVTTIEAVRISWASGAVPPQVHEVILHRPEN